MRIVNRLCGNAGSFNLVGQNDSCLKMTTEAVVQRATDTAMKEKMERTIKEASAKKVKEGYEKEDQEDSEKEGEGGRSKEKQKRQNRQKDCRGCQGVAANFNITSNQLFDFNMATPTPNQVEHNQTF